MLRIAIICAGALLTTACANASFGSLATALNERGCATEGEASGAAGLTGPTVSGHVKWHCDGKQVAPADPTTQTE